MPDCHKCKWNGKGNKRCLKCKGPSMSPNHHGEIHISLEYLQNSQILNNRITKQRESKLAEFMRSWIHMNTKTRNLVSAIMANTTISQAAIARKLNVSRQAVHKNLVNIIKEHPTLKSVLTQKMKALRK